MFSIKVDTIRDRTTNGPTYMKGRQYYRQGMVKNLTYDQDKGIILAQVEGTRTYNVRIILNGKGELHDATCTCSAFAAYWGLCRHIAATLLFCVDAFGQQKTHILQDNAKPDNVSPGNEDSEQNDVQAAVRQEAAEDAIRDWPASDGISDAGNAGKAADANAAVIRSQQHHARQQAQRKSRSKTRDFLARMEHVVQLADPSGKQPVRLQVTLHCSPASCTLPWLSFSIGEIQLYPVSNVEQFAEAVSRDLALELDKDFTLDPMRHAFLPQDQPLITMLQDAFENDYKAVFGTSHASSRDRFFTMNASRFAAFLSISGSLSDCHWQNIKDQSIQPIHIRRTTLPVRLCLRSDDPADGSSGPSGFRLELDCDQPPLQMTASRNIYLVGDTFFLPPPESIRMIEPILSVFNSPGMRQLSLTREEAIYLLGDIQPQLLSVCPLVLENQLAEKIVDEPLCCVVELDYGSAALRAAVSFHYGSSTILPLAAPKDESSLDLLILRDRQKEEKLLQTLSQAGFTRQGSSWRLTDSDDIYAFLTVVRQQLADLAEIRETPAFKKIRVLPPPSIQIGFALSSDQESLELNREFTGLPQEEYNAYIQSLREKRAYFRTRDGNFRQVSLQNRDLLLQLMDLMLLWGLEPGKSLCRLPRYRAMALEGLLTDKAAGQLIKADESVLLMIRHLSEPGSLIFRMPQSLHGKLRPYQKIGYQWLRSLDYYGLGGILADDMGLGKTLQTIAFVMAIWQKQKKPSLIIAPTSLVYNWLSEFERFAPKLPVMVLDGSRQQRTSRLGEITGQACTITSYSLLRRDIEEIGSCDFASCFLDEAQNIKNPETLNARSVKQVRADRYFALTGTPLENSLTELWSIFDFILPGYLFGHKSFQNLYELPITRDGSQEALDALHRQIAPFVLRRMKKDVLKELPDKIETRSICDMTEEQREIYQSFLLRSKTDLEQEINLNGYARSQIYILALLTRLRQICCHPALFMKNYQGGSGKLSLLEELLADSFSAGHRVLVFSQFTSMLELIRENQLAVGCESFYIDGQVAADDRMSQVQRFNQGEGKLFLISLRAGGTGLNLTGADTVIHFDPWWNPAVEDQATDRAYRIGQENVVQVIKLYTRHSIEEKIHQLQERKQNLIDRVIKPGQNLLSKMTLEEVRSLFEL
jgi:SNF2 family DNA or RNA helicase